ncbi:hypothetical protein AVEN_117428-1 [Araneus ventricosus]|uniref:Uncharacterized protein n=1 Tax=Araneus ventricosus TaxID=182803 RepID=A0A4Y2S6A1_ARAVE|nr:hypothetical protein AVEN_117428-1 [Araneus ventricosus]
MDALIPAGRKGLDRFSAETLGLLTDPVHVPLLIDSSTQVSRVVIRRFHSRNRGTVGHNVLLPRAWQVLDVFASLLITLTPPEYGSPCETLLSAHLFHPEINL